MLEISCGTILFTIKNNEILYLLIKDNKGICISYLGDFSNQIPKSNETFEHFDFLILPFLDAYEMLSFPDTKLLLKQVNEYLKNNMWGFKHIGQKFIGYRIRTPLPKRNDNFRKKIVISFCSLRL